MRLPDYPVVMKITEEIRLAVFHRTLRVTPIAGSQMGFVERA